MRRFRAIFSLLALLACLLPATAFAIDVGGVSAKPANPVPGDERTASWFVYALAPGETKNDSLLVTNNTAAAATFDLYAADSTPTTGNGFALKQKVETMTGVGSWVKLEKNSVTLQAHQAVAIPFAVTVPKNAAPNLYAGGIILAAPATTRAAAGAAINLRLGVRMYVTVVASLAAQNNRAALAAGYAVPTAVAALAVLVFFLIIRRKKIISEK